MSNFARFMKAAAGTTAASGSSGGGTQDSSGYFANTAFQLKTSSTNAENFLTISDSSSSSHTITTNAGTKVSSWNNFRATDTTTADASDSDFVQVASGQHPPLNYIQVPAGTPFAYGTGDFTFETWVSPMVVGTHYLWSQVVSGSNYILWNYTSTVYGAWVGHPIAGSTNTHYNWPEGFRQYKWYHLAMVRESGSLKQYINGKYMGSVSNSVDLSNTTYTPTLGTYTHSTGSSLLQARLYNFRISKTARYTGTSDFYPTMELFTSDSDTSFLLSSNDTRDGFKDLSPHNHTITYSQTDSASGRRALVGNWWTKGNAIYKNEYLPSTQGGSLKFNRGATEYVQVADSSDFSFGSDDWCIECFFWIDEVSTALHTLFAFGNSSNLYKLAVGFRPSNNGLVYGISSNGSSWDLATFDTSSAGYGTVNNDEFIRRWNHLAFVRSGSNISAFVNGTKDFSLTGVSASIISNNYGPTIGAISNDSSQWCGHISQFRVVKGSSVYDPTASTITVPTSKLTAITNTKLLLDFKPSVYDVTTNNYLYDGDLSNRMTTSTTQTKYADTSLYFDGNSFCYLKNNGDYDNNFNIARFTYERDFTIEFWYYQTSRSNSQIVYDQRPAGSQGEYPVLYIKYSGGGYYWAWYTSTADRILSSTVVNLNQWYHVALTRSGSTITLWLDGVSQGTTTNANVMLCDARGPQIGENTTVGGYRFTGYMEDLRITDGHARYTSAFTPPTEALPTYG